MSAADLDTQAAAAVVALGSITRLTESDLLATRDKLAAGTTRFALNVRLVAIVESGPLADANTSRQAADVEVTVHHLLSAGSGERAYRLGQMLTVQAAILPRTFWEALASVYAVAAGPVLSSDPARDGLAISYTVKTQLVLNP